MKLLASAIIFLTAFSALTGCVTHTTGETEVGVRTVKFALFGKKGVEDKIYPPGSTFFFFPFVNDWHTFDTRLQYFEMTSEKTRGGTPIGGGRPRDDLLFKTIDGNDIRLDIIIAYRIDPQKAPYILQYVAKDDERLKEKIGRTIGRSKPRDIFGELKTEEFYVVERREQKAEEVREAIQKIVGHMGIIVEKVLTKDYMFKPEYQKAIEDKKIADQLVEKHKSSQRAAKEEYEKKLQDVQGEVNKMIANVDGEYRKAKIKADAYYEQQKSIAKAIRAEGIAEAKGIQEMNKALAGEGGEAIVKLRIAEALQDKKILLLPVSEGGMNLKTTDVNKLIEIMGIKALSSGEKDKKAEAAPKEE
ncbi:MAG: prohibitin family protein [Nitrospirae bacterium]|nr:prohibitin family protein [Nitrospirota bacterium]